jgi:hypothetical protein
MHRAAEALAAGIDGARSVILYGSLTAGGFRPGRSDLDLLVVVDDGLTDAQAAALQDLVRHADPGAAAGIDLQVVTAAVAAAPTPAPALELHIGRYGDAPLEVERRVPEYPDLLAELSMARADGRALRGAAPHQVLGPVPPDWVVERGRYWLRTWQSRTGDAEHAAFMVLTACRMWRFAVEGGHSPKLEAARWALDRRPSLVAIRQAIQQYEHDPAAPVDEPGIAELLAAVLRHQ